MRRLDLEQGIDEVLLFLLADGHDLVVGDLQAVTAPGHRGRTGRRQRAVDGPLGLDGRLFRQMAPALGQQDLETLHQQIDLVLFALEFPVGHAHFALPHLFPNALLLACRILLRALLDFPARGTEHSQQAVVHFRTERGLGQQIVRLVADQGCGHVGSCVDAAAGLVDRALHVLLPLRFQGSAFFDFLGCGNAVVDLEVQIARFGNDGLAVRRFDGQRSPLTSGRSRRPVGPFGDVVQDRAGNEVAGIAAQGLAGQGLGMFEVAAVEVLESQVVQPASAGFNLLFCRGQTLAIDQRQRPAAIDLRLIDQRHQIAVVGVGLQGGDVEGQSLAPAGPSTSISTRPAVAAFAVPTTTLSRSLRIGGNVFG